MKIVLLSLPGLSPFSPPLSILSLSSYLKAHGVEAVPIDTSIEAIHYILNPDMLFKRLSLAEERFVSMGKIKPKSAYNELKLIKAQLQYIKEIIINIWSKDGLNIDACNFKSQIDAINKALIFDSLNYTSSTYSLNHLALTESIFHDKTQNPFIDYFQHDLVQRIADYDPDLIGISLSYQQQELCGLSLINEIKEKLDIPIVVGGSYFSLLCNELTGSEANIVLEKDSQMAFSAISPFGISHKDRQVYRKLKPLLNPYGIYGEGEKPLLELCHNLKNEKSCGNISKVLYYDKSRGNIKINRNDMPLNGTDLPIIDLDGIPMKKYLTPFPIAPLMSSRGCYWNKCTFCDHADVIGNKWRQIPSDKVFANIELYAGKYNIKMINFTDEAMSAGMMQKLSEKLIQSDINVKLGTMIRFEQQHINNIELAVKAGFISFSIGLESGSPRIISLMNKGYSHEFAQMFLDKCKQLGINLQMHVIFGFPTETMREAKKTISFLKKNKDAITLIRANSWKLTRCCEIYRSKDKYGVIIDPNAGDGTVPYRIRHGINSKKSESIIDRLMRDKAIGEKFIKFGVFGYSEDYYTIISYLKTLDRTMKYND